jgi:Flp pilus assembly CpaF family ATPase
MISSVWRWRFMGNRLTHSRLHSPAIWHAVLYHGVTRALMDRTSRFVLIRELFDRSRTSPTPEQAQFIEDSVVGGKNLVVVGATSSGKTTLLNAMIALIPVEERLVVIEDAPELKSARATSFAVGSPARRALSGGYSRRCVNAPTA